MIGPEKQAAPARDRDREARTFLGGLVLALGLLLSPPAAVLAAAVVAVERVERRSLLIASAAGLALVALFFAVGLLDSTWAAAFRQAADAPGGLLLNGGEAWAAAQPEVFYGWAALLPLAPTLAVLADLLRDKQLGEAEQRRKRAEQRRSRRTQRAARRADLPVTAKAGEHEGVVIAHKLAGERALPTKARAVILPFDQVRFGVLCAGAPGSGKTESALRLCFALAKALPELSLAYIDGKGDRLAAERFCALMADCGRRARVWPHEPFHGFRGDPWAVYYRVLELGQYPTEGEAFHYRTIAASALRLAISEHPDGPPRSSQKLLGRLDFEALKAAHGEGVRRELSGAQVADVRRRYAGIFGPLRGGADGNWSFEDAEAAYVLIERQRMGEA